MIRRIKRLLVFSSIRSKLIALLLVLVGLPLLITGYLSYRSTTQALLKQTTHQMGNLAEKTAQQIDDFFQSVKRDIDLRPILAVPAAGPAPPGFLKERWFARALQEGLYLSDAARSHGNGRPGIFLGKVVYDFEDPDRPVGVLAFHIKASAYTDFAKSLDIGSGGYAMLTHHRGDIIFHPDNRFRTTADILPNGDDRLRRLIAQSALGKTGYGRYTFQGVQKFLVYAPCRQMPWSVGITVLQGELMADVIRFQKKMISFFVVVIVLILPVSYLFIKGLTRPIQQLIDGAVRIGSGDLDQTIQIESNDELGAVAEEFNKMAVQLKASMDEIIDLKNFNEDILRNVTSGIITVDRRGRITSINPRAAELLGQGLEEGQAHPTPDHLQRILDVVRQTLESGTGVHSVEATITEPGREQLFVEVNTSLLSSKTGKIFGAIAEIRDITQRKRMEEVIRRVEKLASLGELSAGMAHEIRNPLAGIKTSVQVLAKRVTRTESRELLSGIESEINRLNRFVTDLLRFSRPSKPLPAPVDIDRVLDNTLDLMSEKTKAQGIAIERRYDPRTPKAMVDQGQMRQVFLNLLINSFKAMDHGGRLTIDVLPADAQPNGMARFDAGEPLNLSRFVKVVFADSGDGIAPHQLEKVFDPFFTTDPKGTGLGLAIAHKLMEENNGYIFMESVQAEGTRAILLLPNAALEISPSGPETDPYEEAYE
ncbi:MAG: histidine kinase dimerization/phospho-acceptor domain-containing protein [Desulfobacteraceae bacterium]